MGDKCRCESVYTSFYTVDVLKDEGEDCFYLSIIKAILPLSFRIFMSSRLPYSNILLSGRFSFIYVNFRLIDLR